MADIFISYTRQDRVKAQKLAEALERRGWTVWWDTRLRAGEIWDEAIEMQLKAARAAVVLWSDSSVKSRWVRKEARVADKRRILAPAFLQGVELPLEFSDVQAADLIGWEGDQAHPGFIRLIEDITTVLGVEQHSSSGANQAYPSPAHASSVVGKSSNFMTGDQLVFFRRELQRLMEIDHELINSKEDTIRASAKLSEWKKRVAALTGSDDIYKIEADDDRKGRGMYGVLRNVMKKCRQYLEDVLSASSF